MVKAGELDGVSGFQLCRDHDDGESRSAGWVGDFQLCRDLDDDMSIWRARFGN